MYTIVNSNTSENRRNQRDIRKLAMEPHRLLYSSAFGTSEQTREGEKPNAFIYFYLFFIILQPGEEIEINGGYGLWAYATYSTYDHIRRKYI